MAAGHRITFIVAPRFPAELGRIAADRHVWAIRTSEYQRVADAVRRDFCVARGVTLFSADAGGPELALVSIFGDVEWHHGGYSHDPPLDEVQVLGAEATNAVRALLDDYGFTESLPSDSSFVAMRRR